MNIRTLLRELSGPRPLRWAVDIVSKPRFWNHGAKAVSLEAQPAFRVTGSGRAPTLPTSSLPSSGVVPVSNVPISLTYATWGAWDIDD